MNDLINVPFLWQRLYEIDGCFLVLLNEISSYHNYDDLYEAINILIYARARDA